MYTPRISYTPEQTRQPPNQSKSIHNYSRGKMSLEKVTIAEEFRRNSDLKKDEFEALKEWYSKQPHFPPMSDAFLALFFHSCYFHMEPTKVTIDKYLTFRTHVPEFFQDRDPFTTDTKNGKQIVRFIILPSKTSEGFEVACTNFGFTNPSDFNLANSAKAFLMLADLHHYYNGSFNGLLLCFDLSNMQLGHLARLHPLTLKKVVDYLQEALPVRLKGIHFINIVPFMDKIMSLIRPFMKKALVDMIFIHSDMESLYPFIPREMLPNDWGGSAGTIDDLSEKFFQLRKENVKFFEEESKIRVVESKRPGKSKNAGELFGVEGSFKKLDLD